MSGSVRLLPDPPLLHELPGCQLRLHHIYLLCMGLAVIYGVRTFTIASSSAGAHTALALHAH